MQSRHLTAPRRYTKYQNDIVSGIVPLVALPVILDVCFTCLIQKLLAEAIIREYYMERVQP